MHVLVLIDGEHYPPVTRWAIDAARARGHSVIGALFLGGTEKVDAGSLPDVGVETMGAEDQARGLRAAIERFEPDAVLDLSDEPVLGYRERFELISVALAAGRPYLGADFRFDPPPAAPAPEVPTIAVIGTGKRTGKTALAGQLARVAAELGRSPVVVAMGRGGPAAPELARAGTVGLDDLLALIEAGRHAASDYLEDAVTSGVTTVGARRAGGGLAGAAFATNAAEAAAVATDAGGDLLILEGSGSSIPPLAWDAGILVVPASAPEEALAGYLGPYRLLRSDLVVVSMVGSPVAGASDISPLRSTVRRWRDVPVLATDFEPVPLGAVQGKRVFLATTAPEAVAERHVAHLEAQAGCTVVASSSHLSDRSRLRDDMQQSPRYDILLTELKAAAVDVAARAALDAGAQVVFLDNRAISLDAGVSVNGSLAEVVDLATARCAERAGAAGGSR